MEPIHFPIAHKIRIISSQMQFSDGIFKRNLVLFVKKSRKLANPFLEITIDYTAGVDIKANCR